MKKIYLSLFTIILFSYSLTANNTILLSESEKVDMQEVTTEGRPRCIIHLPQVWIDPTLNILMIGFHTENSIFSMIINDEFDCEIYSSARVADGDVHTYQLPVLEEGRYTILIKNEGKSYSGKFMITPWAVK